ncbi:MAG: type II secretion system F family protein [Actinomycetota bacterium]
MMPLVAFCILLPVSLAALLCRIPARRRERALAAFSPRSTPGNALPGGLRRLLLAGYSSSARGSQIYILAAVAGVAAFALTRSVLLASVAFPAAAMARRLATRHRDRRARGRKEEQVLEFIDSLSQSLRAGLSLRQALEVSLEDVGNELGEDVLDILQDIRLGSGMEESLARAAAASSSPSLRLTFKVLALLHGKGGDLPRILERLRKRVADGLEARREARILTSQSRASGYLVSSLPAVFLLLQAALNPGSLRPLFTTPTGNLIIALAVALNTAAFVLIRKMVDQEV